MLALPLCSSSPLSFLGFSLARTRRV
uniref:Uncharacterized protein n=1 Tax=Arundo donax TaxID=35708 RepID=A0A0A9E6Z7_ARUDO